MAPGAHLPKVSPMGKDIQSIVRTMLAEELKITVNIKNQYLGGDETDITVKVGVHLGDKLIAEAEDDFSVFGGER